MKIDVREPIVIGFRASILGDIILSSSKGHHENINWEDARSIATVLHSSEATCKRLGFATFHSPDGFEIAHEEYDMATVTYRIDNLDEARASIISLLTRRGKDSESSKINHPSHYGGKDNPYEAIKVIRAWDLDFSLGNAVKYISRAGKKKGESTADDLKKAIWYLQNKIDELEQG